jgi:lipid A 3-O-deacylase
MKSSQIVRSAIAGVICLGVSHLATASQAEEAPDQQKQEPGGGLTLTIENDFFALTDRNYTNGISLHYAFAPSDTPALSYWIGERLLGAGPDAYVRAGFAIGHTIYTPEDTDANPPPPDQHPYAAYLFLRGTLLVDHGSMADSVALDLGIVGPAAGGEWVQNNFHDLINDDPSRGWDSQIGNEPIINLTASRRWRVPLIGDEEGLGFDTVPMISGSLGNFRTEAAAGAIVRFGYDLAADYGPLRVQPSLYAGSLAGGPTPFSWYVYLGAAGHAVAHDITLDGNTFKDSASVDRKPFVGEISAGLVMRIYDVKVSYSYVATTPTFEGTGASQRYASISLTIGF